MPDSKKLFADLMAGDDELAEAAAHQIAAFGEAAIPALGDLLNAADADTRWWAARTLALIATPEVGTLLAGLLKDEDLAVRQCAALGLREHPHADAIPALIAALPAEDQLLRRLAADALIAIGADAISALSDVMQNGPQTVRLEAVRALAKMQDQGTIPVLFAYLEDDSAFIRHWAEEGLERLGVGMTFFQPQ